MIDRAKLGKKNRTKGRNFELKVRHDLEKQGWFVAKWTNTIENGKFIPAKRKYNPFTKFVSFGNGFPDLIAFKDNVCSLCKARGYEVRAGMELCFVEAKSAKYLSKKEKADAKWITENVAPVWIAHKGKKRGSIEYKEFKE